MIAYLVYIIALMSSLYLLPAHEPMQGIEQDTQLDLYEQQIKAHLEHTKCYEHSSVDVPSRGLKKQFLLVLMAYKTSAWDHAGKNWIKHQDLDGPLQQASALIDCIDKNDPFMSCFPEHPLMQALNTSHLSLTPLFNTPSIWGYSQNLLQAITGERLNRNEMLKSSYHARQVEQWVAQKTNELAQQHDIYSEKFDTTFHRKPIEKRKIDDAYPGSRAPNYHPSQLRAVCDQYGRFTHYECTYTDGQL